MRVLCWLIGHEWPPPNALGEWRCGRCKALLDVPSGATDTKDED